ncbi:MAG: DUF1343 domain-containing protein [Gemmatimonadales bacterium]
MSLILLLAIAAAQPTVVRPGVEVLATDSIGLVKGRRVGLVTNYAAVGRDGRSAVDILLGAGVRLTALFSPEHGFRGAADPGEAVASTVDSATGLPIYSLYGRTSLPTAEMLADVDVIAVDLPDVGARYYTYLHTTIEVMRAAARSGKQVLVLDRPNPIGDGSGGALVAPLVRYWRPRHPLGSSASRRAGCQLRLHRLVHLAVPAARWRAGRISHATTCRSCQLTSDVGAFTVRPYCSKAPRCRWGGGPTSPSTRSGRPGSTPRRSWPSSGRRGSRASGSSRRPSGRWHRATRSIPTSSSPGSGS